MNNHIPNQKQKIWLDGKIIPWRKATVHVMTHALHYGTAIFEGMRCYNTQNGPAVFRMKDHYKRLVSGTKAYEFDMKYSAETLCSETKKLLRVNHLQECYIRPICFAGEGTFGLNILGAKFRFAIIPVIVGKYFGKKAETGISCEISSWKRISSQMLSPHVKASANYLNSALAKLESTNAGYDEAIMLSEEGHVSEGSGENLFIVSGGKLMTPPLHDGVLSGITRESIITIARRENLLVEERTILRDELYTADEVFLCGTAAEITPVISVDKRIIGIAGNGRGKEKDGGKPGKITKKLREIFFNVIHGKDKRFFEWLDFVEEV